MYKKITIVDMKEERLDTKQAKFWVKLTAPILAIVIILIFIVLPVKFINTALRKESEEKKTEINRAIDFNLFDWLK